jgi:DNA-nicking Smr family endonuclease
MKRVRPLSDDDRILWNKVAKSAVPLKGTLPLLPDPQLVAPLAETVVMPGLAGIDTTGPSVPKKLQPVVRHIDRPTYEKLSKGKLIVEATIDLHGMTQAEAYSFLLSFLHQAHSMGTRYVMVITGKGGSTTKGQGVLRRVVPEWLATPAFRLVVSSHDRAARHHGGAGALYVRLRKRA